MLRQAARYYHTLKYLQWIQIKYRLRKMLKGSNAASEIEQSATEKTLGNEKLVFQPSIFNPTSYTTDNTFEFLNIKNQFSTNIDWNFNQQGKLWTYHLNYFEFLGQADMNLDEGLRLIHDFISKEKLIKDGFEPYPISLRCISWIKFILKHQINDAKINDSLRRQLAMLSKNPEYHLLGNHLLENGFSLLFGACYFIDEQLHLQAEEIISTQLKEQILADGGHFELSPMYHQIMLFRILDCINLLQNNVKPNKSSLVSLLQSKAKLMLGWLKQMTFADGTLPRVNDSTNNFGLDTQKLLAYAKSLQIAPGPKALSDSGYRMIRNSKYELLIDVGQIGPDYIPGHAHSDTFNFILHHRGQPIVVDTGISTYEKNKKRTQERSTAAHNTVCLQGTEQSEVWGGFRVARRANIIDLNKVGNKIQASHDGYKRLGVIHQRSFIPEESTLTIVDEINSDKPAQAFLHFHPNCKVELINNQLKGDFGQITFSAADKISLHAYDYAHGFNHTESGSQVTINFHETLQTKIHLT